MTDEGAPALRQLRQVLRETDRLGQILAEQDELVGPDRLGVIPTLATPVILLALRFAAAAGFFVSFALSGG